jgi:hypothetical protein
MQTLFTVHAGEYLVGSHIERNFKNYNVWVPSRDSGIDLLVTNSNNKRTISLQVKFSKDYVPTHMEPLLQNKVKAWGWWTLNKDKIKNSSADLWIQSFHDKTIEYIVVPHRELYKKLKKIHGNKKLIQSYLWVTNKNKCWETRGLSKEDQKSIVNNLYSNDSRNFTVYLNNWKLLKRRLGRK